MCIYIYICIYIQRERERERDYVRACLRALVRMFRVERGHGGLVAPGLGLRRGLGPAAARRRARWVYLIAYVRIMIHSCIMLFI